MLSNGIVKNKWWIKFWDTQLRLMFRYEFGFDNCQMKFISRCLDYGKHSYAYMLLLKADFPIGDEQWWKMNFYDSTLPYSWNYFYGYSMEYATSSLYLISEWCDQYCKHLICINICEWYFNPFWKILLCISFYHYHFSMLLKTIFKFCTYPKNQYMAQRLECSPMARETWVQFQVESYQRL